MGVIVVVSIRNTTVTPRAGVGSMIYVTTNKIVKIRMIGIIIVIIIMARAGETTVAKQLHPQRR
jgi:hypothetical protein